MDDRIIQKIEERLSTVKAKDMMSAPVVSTTSDALLVDTASAMLEKKISGMPVLGAGGAVEGIITATDLFVGMGVIKHGTAIQREKVPLRDPKVKTLMTEHVITVGEDETLGQIIELMIHNGIHTLPVVRDGALVGVIGRRDVIKRFYVAVKEIIR